MTHNSPLAVFFSLADQLVNLIGGLFERQLSIKVANNCRLIKRRLFILARFLPLVCIYAAKTMSDISPASDKLVVCCVCDFGAAARCVRRESLLRYRTPIRITNPAYN